MAEKLLTNQQARYMRAFFMSIGIMARPSKLTDKQWNEIERRNLAGESIRSLSKEFGITEGALRKRISTHVSQIKEVANQIISAESALKSLPISTQINTLNYVNELREISTHLAGAAKHGAMTAHRLAILANSKVDKIDETKTLAENEEALKFIAGITKISNDAANTGLNLLNANKESTRPEPDKVPEGLNHFYGEQ